MSQSQPRTQVVLDREYDGSTGTLRAVRSDVVDCLTTCGVGHDLQERAELVTSELATNAVQAAPGHPFNVRLSYEEGSILMAVTSHTANGVPPDRSGWGPASLFAPTGRGLMIVDELSDQVQVELPEPGTVVVTAVLR